MAERHRLVLVNYLNTLPFLAGLNHAFGKKHDLLLAHPAECAQTLFTGQADIGLIPIGALIDKNGWTRVTDFGIGCDGPVATVCLFGHTPLHEWDHVFLDYQSRTSVLLARILLAEYWNHQPKLIEAFPGFENQISEQTGGLIIGDRAILAREKYRYCYDLGEAWKAMTGLPFVFAVWIAMSHIEPEFEHEMIRAFESGMTSIPDIVSTEGKQYPNFDLVYYYKQNIRYKLDGEALQGMEKFVELARQIPDLGKSS